jgi:hypothetical protein
MRIEAAAGRGDGIGGNGFVRVYGVLLPIGVNAVFDRIIQFLRSRPEIAAAGTRGVVAVASR